MKVTFLGHCANQTATNEAVAFIVDCGETSILIETGPGIVRQLLRAGRHCTGSTSCGRPGKHRY